MADLPVPADENGGKIHLQLRRLSNPGKPPVLLLHGASARSESFEIPQPGLDGKPRSLAGWLAAEGFEPWLLDWRGSSRVVDESRDEDGQRSIEVRPDVFDFDHAAEFDVPAALEKIRGETGANEIHAVGHCMGAATLAESIAAGHVKDHHRLRRVVLLTLGLFYDATRSSELKAHTGTGTLEQLQSQGVCEVDSRADLAERPDWPPSLQSAYEQSRETHPLAHGDAEKICNRLTFMYGSPYLESQLVPEVHHDTWVLGFEKGERIPQTGEVLKGEGGAEGRCVELRVDHEGWSEGTAKGELTLFGGGSPGFVEGEKLRSEGRDVATIEKQRFYRAELPHQFGSIPLWMYGHGIHNLNRGHAGPNEAKADRTLVGSDQADRFNELQKVTLITGKQNALWQPPSIKAMYDWLRNHERDGPGRFVRHIIPGFAHQDLLWGRASPTKVFRKIRTGLGGDA